MIKISSEKDPNSLFHKRKIKVGKTKIETPIKAIDLSKLTRNSLPDEIRGLNYIYKRWGDTKKRGQTWINDLKFDPKKEAGFTYNINTLKNKSRDKEINLFLIEYDGSSYPTGEDLRLITNKIHANSTITTLPIIDNLRKRISDGKLKAFEKYMEFVDNCFNEVKTLNYKPIMGMVPVLTPTYTSKITNYYLKKDVNAFCIDFDRRAPSTTSENVTALLKTINDYDGDLDNAFIMSINLNSGRAGKNADVIFPKDIISFGFAIDGFGDLHKRIGFKPSPSLPPPPGSAEKQELNKLRLFVKEDYGYYKVGVSGLRKIYPKDSNISIDVLLENTKYKTDNRLQNAFNIEQQGIEALHLRKLILDQEVKKYIENKKYVKAEDISKMNKVQQNLKGGRQSDLFDF